MRNSVFAGNGEWSQVILSSVGFRKKDTTRTAMMINFKCIFEQLVGNQRCILAINQESFGITQGEDGKAVECVQSPYDSFQRI